jgi:uncharacterized cofD-like protein
LVDDIVEAIQGSQATKVYICNIMTQPGETEGFSLEDHLRALSEHSCGLEFDCVLVNSALIGDDLRARYLADGSVQVGLDGPAAGCATKAAGSSGLSGIVARDLLNESGVVRHDPVKLARALLEIYSSEKLFSIEQVIGR